MVLVICVGGGGEGAKGPKIHAITKAGKPLALCFPDNEFHAALRAFKSTEIKYSAK
jgi:hypothetical protein